MARKEYAIQTIGGNLHIKRIADLAQTIRETFATFGIIFYVDEVKITSDTLCFLLRPKEPVRMHTVRGFEDDLRFALGREQVLIEAPLPNTKYVGVTLGLDVAREIFDMPEPEGVPSPWSVLEDDLYDEARALVEQSGKATASFLQRKLRIGYARAARLMDLLEEHGIIDPQDRSSHYDDPSDDSDRDNSDQ